LTVQIDLEITQKISRLPLGLLTPLRLLNTPSEEIASNQRVTVWHAF
jgi:hypothetical protein